HTRVGVTAVRAPASPAQSGVRGEASEGGRSPPPSFLELGDARARAVLVLLGRTTAHAARALGHAVPDDRHAALAQDHVAPLRGGDALDDGTAGPLRELAAR